MNEAANGPLLYRVSYTVRVQKHLLTLGKTARERGDIDDFIASAKEFHRRLCLYPQFGEQLQDLNHKRAVVWIGFVRPLAMRSASSKINAS